MTRAEIVYIIQTIDEQIPKIILGGVASFSVAGGTSYENLSLDQLTKLRSYYANMLYLYDYSANGTTVRTFPQYFGTTSNQGNGQ